MLDDLTLETHGDFEGNPSYPSLDEEWWQSLLIEIENEAERFRINEMGNTAGSEKEAVNWEIVKRLYQSDETICAWVMAYNQGGILVERDGLRGFVPLSHLVRLGKIDKGDVHAECFEVLRSYVGKQITLKIIEYDPARGRIVFSERAALAEPGCRNRLFATLQSGARVTGQVTTITDFGAFVDLGGVEGLIHISELSWGRVRHPSDILKVGDEVTALVLRVDPVRCRIALSLKRLKDNPWTTIEQRYAIGQLISARVTAIMPYGVFVHVEDGVDGLIHVSEFNRADKGTVLEELRVGQVVRACIMLIDAAKQRLGLGLLRDEVA